MNKIYTLFLIGLFTLGWNTINAQADLPFGDFENWTDDTEFINANLYTDYDAETFLFPQEFDMLVRLFVVSFLVDLEELVMTAPLETVAVDIYGLERSELARNGNHCMKFGGDVTVGLSAGTFSAENVGNNVPSSLSFYYQHSGLEGDTLFLGYAFGESALDMINADSINSPFAAHFGLLDTIIAGTDSSWQWIQIPTQENNTEISSDSLTIAMIRDGQPLRDQYILIDDMQWNIETPTIDLENDITFRLGQSLNNTTIYPYLESKIHTFTGYSIFDQAGRLVSTSSEWNDAIDISHLDSGSYFFQLNTTAGTYAKPFVRY